MVLKRKEGTTRPDDELIQKAEEAGRNLTARQKRELVRFTIREMSADNWLGVKALIDNRFTHPRKADELKVLELVLREGESESNLDQTQAELTHGNAKGLIYELVDKIRSDGVLMMRMHAINNKLIKVPAVSREELRWALHRMPQEHRNYVLSFIPPNPLMEDKTRDQSLAHDLFDHDLSDEQLASRYGVSKNGAKSTTGAILTGLVKRPLARKDVDEYLKQVDKIESMEPAEVRDKLRGLSAKKRREIIEAIPVHTWKKRGAAPRHKQIALEYLSGMWSVREFTETYNQRHASEDLKQRAADQAIAHILERITKEPQLVDRLRFYSGEIPEPQLAKLKPPAEMAAVEMPGPEPIVARKPLSLHIRAVLSNMVGDVRAFCKETGLSEDFLHTIDLEGLSQVFGRHKIKMRSATACVATIIHRQSGAGGTGLTTEGLERSLDALDKMDFVVREIRADTAGPPIHVEEVPGKYRSYVLHLNLDNAFEITDDSLLEYAKPKSVAGAKEKVTEQIVEIPPMELPEVLKAEVITPEPAPGKKIKLPVKRPKPPSMEKAKLAPPAEKPEPAPPAEKPKSLPPKPEEEVEKPKAPELPPLTLDGFDKMLSEFRSKHKDRGAMMNAAGLKIGGLKRPFMELIKAGDSVSEEGEKILTFIPLIRKEKSLETLGRILGHFEDALLGWMEKTLTEEDLPRLALYKVLSSEVGISEGISKRMDEVGKRYRRVGRDYCGFVDDITEKAGKGEVSESLLWAYADIEDKYINLVKALDPKLDRKIEECSKI